jgi:hypothetical protein
MIEWWFCMPRGDGIIENLHPYFVQIDCVRTKARTVAVGGGHRQPEHFQSGRDRLPAGFCGLARG